MPTVAGWAIGGVVGLSGAVAKKCTRGGVVRVYPEADSVKAVAAQTGRPFAEVFAEACTAALPSRRDRSKKE